MLSVVLLFIPLAIFFALYDMDNGNLNGPVTGANFCTPGTIAVSSGKWYWEIKVVAEGNASNSVGVCRTSAGLESDTGALWNASGDVVFMYLAVFRCNGNILNPFGIPKEIF